MWSRSLVNVALIVTVTLAGCSNHNPARLPWPAHITSIESISDEGKTKIRTIIDELNGKVGKKAITESPQGEFEIRIAIVAPTETTQTRAGYATVYQDKCNIEISSVLFEETRKAYLEPVLWHEIGHCAGLSHDSTMGEIMYKTAEPGERYTDEAIDRFFLQLKISAGL